MWTVADWSRHDRSKLRYPTDLTDAEWASIEPLIPPARRGGNKRTVDMRIVVDGLMYILGTGCQWAALPKDLAARSTVHDYVSLWTWDGATGQLHHALHVRCRKQAGREASPTVGIIDSQSVKGTGEGGARTRAALMPAGRSRAGSATSWSTPRAC